MKYLTIFDGKTCFIKLWTLLDLRAELDLRLTNTIFTEIETFLACLDTIKGRLQNNESVKASLSTK